MAMVYKLKSYNLPHVVNPVLCLGRDKDKINRPSCCGSYLDKVIQDIVLQMFVHSSCTAAAFTVYRAPHCHVSVTLDLREGRFFSHSLLSRIIHALTGHSHDSL